MTSKEKRFNQKSIIIGIFNLCIFALCMVWNRWYYIRWACMPDRREFTLALCLLDMCWIINALIYFRQSNNKIYRDGFEEDDGRKKRTPVIGIVLIILMGIIAPILKSCANSYTNYLYNSQVIYEQNTLCDIREALIVSLEYFENDENRESIIDELNDGLYICEKSRLDGEFWEEFANHYCINVFSEIGNDFKLEGKKPEIYIQMIDGNIIVELKNPCKEINLPMISTGKENERLSGY